MAGVRIVTDSSCDLTDEEVRAHGIEVVPLTDPLRRRGVRGPRPSSPWRRSTRSWRRASDLPETAAPAPGKFEAAFRRQQEAGADAVVCINLSSDLSATMQSAQNAATAAAGSLDVRVVDSRSDHPRARHAGAAGRRGRCRRRVGRRGRGPGGGPGPTHPRGRRPRHPRQPEEGRPHRRRPGAARLAPVDQADRRHLHRQGGGGRQGPHAEEGPRGPARQAGGRRRRRAPLRHPRPGPRGRPSSSTCSPPSTRGTRSASAPSARSSAPTAAPG